jgi:hypothetical protein
MELLARPLTNQLYLISTHRGSLSALTEMIAPAALRGPVQVLDGGNRFSLHRCSRLLAHALAKQSSSLSLTQALENIHLARAFTCYQVMSLLAQTPSQPYPTLVLDLLSTFYDENVPGPEARRLLASAAAELRRLCALAPVVVSAAPLPPKAPQDRHVFPKMLESAADHVWFLEDPHPPQGSRQLPFDF